MQPHIMKSLGWVTVAAVSSLNQLSLALKLTVTGVATPVSSTNGISVADVEAFESWLFQFACGTKPATEAAGRAGPAASAPPVRPWKFRPMLPMAACEELPS